MMPVDSESSSKIVPLESDDAGLFGEIGSGHVLIAPAMRRMDDGGASAYLESTNSKSPTHPQSVWVELSEEF